ncbi:MAG: acetylornithine transaminase [Candidatus Dormiibacterota bacterium]
MGANGPGVDAGLGSGLTLWAPPGSEGRLPKPNLPGRGGAAGAMITLQARAEAALCDTYHRLPVTLVRGEGAWVFTEGGAQLLDMVAGVAVSVLGHAHPALVDAISTQAAALIHTGNVAYSEPQVRLAERLVSGAFPARVFFSNSGAEANEAAIKIARKWGRLRRGGAHVVVTLTGAFHGRTLGALAATGLPRYCDPFSPIPTGFRKVACGDLEALEAALDDQTAAVLLEPIQGESGVVPLSDAYLAAVRQLCDRHGCLLMVDEVQSGMARTGRLWAHQWADIRPDVMTVAKGLAGGVPIGATLVAPHADVLEPGDHGSTFGGGPLASAAGLAVLATIERDRLAERAEEVGARLMSRLGQLRDSGAPILDLRGRGLMVGLTLRRPVAAAVAEAAVGEGLLVNAVGRRTLRLVPPLILTEEQADLAVERLGAALELGGRRAS